MRNTRRCPVNRHAGIRDRRPLLVWQAIDQSDGDWNLLAERKTSDFGDVLFAWRKWVGGNHRGARGEMRSQPISGSADEGTGWRWPVSGSQDTRSEAGIRPGGGVRVAPRSEIPKMVTFDGSRIGG